MEWDYCFGNKVVTIEYQARRNETFMYIIRPRCFIIFLFFRYRNLKILKFLLWVTIVFLFLQTKSFCFPKERVRTSIWKEVILSLKLRKFKTRGNERKNARVHDMLSSDIYHIGRGQLFIILSRLPKA